ncbi:response regulator [Cupriavidus pauculus]|uniref:response regulator n=1 Tax=Cupriavidus pauculus TaxID=82633 RepID=UPI001EE2ACCC|nr:response regulator [Cupriavidus pauculus]GJG98399.1 response regulator [Cupriavidus pauculus]
MDLRSSILVVDDHINIRDPLAAYLRRFDFDVETVGDGKAMRQRLEERRFSLIVLDVMLPGEDGLSLCRYVAEHVGTPVILLTAVTEQADRIIGLEIGASDYVVKPFDPRELVARIRSVLRRNRIIEPVETTPAPSPAQTEYQFTFSGWTFNTRSRELRNPCNEDVPLSTAEFHLLRALVENSNRVMSRSRILDLTQRSETVTFDRSIDSQISRLRKKLEPDPRRPEMLKTVRGDGYLLTSKVMVAPA